ncbi:hypothetical protein DRH14_03035 [Candidatus Shapirobacteria bacterium]|nr:MAG: hypothetical protein DRH14_03035 [Candidatus Shapirobacteria bacterium]
MKLRLLSYKLEIIPEDTLEDKRDTAYIEEVLGLKKEGDSIPLVRRNASGLSCLGCLEAKREK